METDPAHEDRMARWIQQIYTKPPELRSTSQIAMDTELHKNYTRAQTKTEKLIVRRIRLKNRRVWMAAYCLPVPMRKNAKRLQEYDPFSNHQPDYPHSKDPWGDNIIPDFHANGGPLQDLEPIDNRDMARIDRMAMRELEEEDVNDVKNIDVMKANIEEWKSKQAAWNEKAKDMVVNDNFMNHPDFNKYDSDSSTDLFVLTEEDIAKIKQIVQIKKEKREQREQREKESKGKEHNTTQGNF